MLAPLQPKKQLYISLVRSQLLYCSELCRPQLLKDVFTMERVQRRATVQLSLKLTLACSKQRASNRFCRSTRELLACWLYGTRAYMHDKIQCPRASIHSTRHARATPRGTPEDYHTQTDALAWLMHGMKLIKWKGLTLSYIHC